MESAGGARERSEGSKGVRETCEREKGSGGAKRRKRKLSEAQEGHKGKEEMTTQEKCVETKKETNSTHEENDVSKRHMK